MTYAPQALRDLAAYYVKHGGVNLGIVGDTRHQAKGRSYHLGKSQLTPDAYSRKTARDRAGLTEAASALDLGKLNGNLGQLRAFSRWFVNRCRTNAPGTQDVREFIYSPDGKTVLRWDRERGVNSTPRTGEADNSHLGHSHISFYRDSEKRSKVGLFRPYFEPAQPVTPPATPAKEEPVSEHERTIAAIQTRTGYLKNEVEAGDAAGAAIQAAKIAEFALRFVALPEVPAAIAEAGQAEVNDQWFDREAATYTTANAPDGAERGNLIEMTVEQQVAWWTDVFSHRYDLSQVKAGLLPGGDVLSPEGVRAAQSLKGSGNLAPSDYNPLGLPVVP